MSRKKAWPRKATKPSPFILYPSLLTPYRCPLHSSTQQRQSWRLFAVFDRLQDALEVFSRPFLAVHGKVRVDREPFRDVPPNPARMVEVGVSDDHFGQRFVRQKLVRLCEQRFRARFTERRLHELRMIGEFDEGAIFRSASQEPNAFRHFL